MYRLGDKLPATLGNMWDIIRGYVAVEPGVTHERLVALMMGRPIDTWPRKVLDDPSVQEIGSERWCHGYVQGAIREGYLKRE